MEELEEALEEISRAARAFKNEFLAEVGGQVKDWARTALEKGASLAHKWCRRAYEFDTLAHQERAGDEILCSPDKMLEARTSRWAGFWRDRHQEDAEGTKADLRVAG